MDTLVCSTETCTAAAARTLNNPLLSLKISSEPESYLRKYRSISYTIAQLMSYTVMESYTTIGTTVSLQADVYPEARR